MKQGALQKKSNKLMAINEGVFEMNKNLAIANRSHVSCTHNTLRASIVTLSP